VKLTFWLEEGARWRRVLPLGPAVGARTGLVCPSAPPHTSNDTAVLAELVRLEALAAAHAGTMERDATPTVVGSQQASQRPRNRKGEPARTLLNTLLNVASSSSRELTQLRLIWKLLDCNTLCEISGLVYVAASADGYVVGEELEGDYFEDW